MDDRTVDVVRNLANQLALRLASPDGANALRLMAALTSSATPSSSGAADVSGIGLWERVDGGERDVFVRGRHDEWRLWADVERLGRKSGFGRVVLLGGSVARGFLHEPRYTPAMVLEAILRDSGVPSAEVVDLARTSITAGPLMEVVRAALQLQPDALVVFAGNNWHPSRPPQLTAAEIQAIGERVLEADSWAAATGEVERHLRRTATTVCTTLGEVARAAGIPVVFLIPEFNLADWRSASGELPLIPSEGMVEWRRLRAQAERARADGDRATAEASARAMLTLDDGTMGCTFELLHDSGRRDRSVEERRALLERARDAGLGVFPGTARRAAPRPCRTLCGGSYRCTG